jgi:putative membrane protein
MQGENWTALRSALHGVQRKGEIRMMGGFFGGCCGFGSLGVLGVVLNLIITVGVILGFVLLIIWLVRRLTPAEKGITSVGGIETPGASAREIVQARYASGEITRDQYQQMLADLS